VLVNVVVAVLLEKMVDDEPEITEEEQNQMKEKKANFPAQNDAIAGPEEADLTAVPDKATVAAIPTTAADASPAVMAELRSMREQIDQILKSVSQGAAGALPPLDTLES
jgi:hypothetical protein